MRATPRVIEWPTILLIPVTYAVWAFSTTHLWAYSPLLAIVVASLAVAQQSSLMHEALHGHPTKSDHLNHALIFLPIGVLYPYGRFRDLHLAHHHDPNLTDPYDDPESNFQDPAVWAQLPVWKKLLLRFNNTLSGRILIGTALGATSFIGGDIRLMLQGDRNVRRDWALHGLGLALVVCWLFSAAEMPLWAAFLAAYAGNALIKIRSFLEHRAHELFRARTVVVEDRGPLSWLFLNNNYHVVHHCHPTVAWYDLPALYRGNRAHFLRRNEAYVYRSYAEIFRTFLFRTKDPVPHPIYPVKRSEAGKTAAE